MARFGVFCLSLFLCLPLLGQARKSVFIVTDAEGVAGVCRQDQTDPKDAEMRRLLTGETNAAVEGFLEGGAEEVIVWDAHDGSQTLSVETIHPRAKLIMGGLGVTGLLERRYGGLAFIGQHARANSRGGVMAHSYSSLGIQNMRMNGKPVGEVETRVALAGWYGTPAILITGDQVATAQLTAIVPEAEVAVVKEGLANYVCISLSAEAARAMIRDAARRAARKMGQIKPYRIDGPVTFEIERTSRNALGIDAGKAPGTEMIDARTLRYHGKDFLEAWIRMMGQ